MTDLEQKGAPTPQVIVDHSSFEQTLEGLNGVAVRQITQFGEAIIQTVGGDACPCEQRNLYKVMALPDGKKALTGQKDSAGWRPSGRELLELPQLLIAKEESSFMERFCLGCLGCM